MWIGKPLRIINDWLPLAFALLVVVMIFVNDHRRSKDSCERVEAVNEAYMEGFRAGQIDGVQQCVDRVEQWNKERSENDSTRQP